MEVLVEAAAKESCTSLAVIINTLCLWFAFPPTNIYTHAPHLTHHLKIAKINSFLNLTKKKRKENTLFKISFAILISR